MTHHTCPECCTALSYVDATLQFDAAPLTDVSRWWRLRHPWLWRDVQARRGYAATLLDESSK